VLLCLGAWKNGFAVAFIEQLWNREQHEVFEASVGFGVLLEPQVSVVKHLTEHTAKHFNFF